MKFRSWAAAVLAVSLFATACGGDDTTDTDTGTDTGTETSTETETEGMANEDWPDKLVIGLVPSREADVLVESAQPLADALSEALGIEVEPFVPQDYTGLTEAMASGQADIGAFGPLGIVRAQERANVDFILQSERFGSFTYHTQYMTNNPDKYCQDEPQANEDGFLFCNGTLDADEGPVGADAIAMIEAGTKLAFVDPSSTSGYLIPALQMMENGVSLDELDSVFAGGHDAAVIAVVNGDVEVGLSFDDARGIVTEEFPEVGEKAVVFAYSEEIPNDGFVIRSDLPESLKQAVVEAMLAYAETEEGAETLNAIYEIDGLREAEQGVLDVVRRADEELGDTLEDDG
ncbi:MAG: phosphate/phosphite/phosphonate ABC transporter substrate-binding protein [Nitriliruptorales bacterium]|nr:phosphate/phosphite/phosphonate ABC transporter substrate-binding protein [Nitriliruptorales bacterium]